MKTLISRTLCCTVAVLSLTALALAQPPDEGSRPPFPEPGGPGGFGGPGGMRQRQPRALTLAMVPVEAMNAYLKLSDEQRTKITKIQEQLRKQRPAPPRPSEEGQPGIPSRQEMEARRTKMEAAQKAATDEILAVLTDDQKKRVPALLKALTAL